MPRTTRSLLRCRRGAVALTASQMFLGALSLGIAMFRGTEVYTALHHEALVGHANFGSSTLGADHARAANVVVNDNVVMTAMMGPRFGVEADNITMDATAQIACRTCPKSPTCYLCKQYARNKPRALAKLLWVRGRQHAVWSALGKLSGDVDRLASIQAAAIATESIARTDPRVSVRFEDPARTQDIWGGSNAAKACRLAADDAIASPMLGHAFPVLMSVNLVNGLPQVLVASFPNVLCMASDAVAHTVELAQIDSVADKTRDECQDLEDRMQCSVAAASGRPGACERFASAEITDLMPVRGAVVLPSNVQPYVGCHRATPNAPLHANGGGYVVRDGAGQLVTCTFDRDKCRTERLRENSDEFLRTALAVPKVVTNVAAALGGSETRMPRLAGWNASPDFCACTYSARPVNESVIGISDGVRKIASFGAAGPSEALRRRREYRSCGRWYFPDGRGEYAGVPPDDQPFVGAWKWSLVDACPGPGGGGG